MCYHVAEGLRFSRNKEDTDQLGYINNNLYLLT